MLGFGVRMNQVFASRWKAVVWSMGVLLTAYCAVPARDQAQVKDSQPVAQLPGLEDIPQIPPPEE